MDAGGGHAVGPGGFDCFEPSLDVTGSAADDPNPHLVAGQTTVDEDRAPLVAGERLAAQSDVVDVDR
jgi:hypothetical protein